MAVVLSDGLYRVAKRAHPSVVDAHGTAVPGAPGALGAARAGAAVEQADGSWTLRLDPAEWQVWAGDEITGPAGRHWVITGTPRLHMNAACSDVDYIGVTAALRDVHI